MVLGTSCSTGTIAIHTYPYNAYLARKEYVRSRAIYSRVQRICCAWCIFVIFFSVEYRRYLCVVLVESRVFRESVESLSRVCRESVGTEATQQHPNRRRHRHANTTSANARTHSPVEVAEGGQHRLIGELVRRGHFREPTDHRISHSKKLCVARKYVQNHTAAAGQHNSSTTAAAAYIQSCRAEAEEGNGMLTNKMSQSMRPKYRKLHWSWCESA